MGSRLGVIRPVYRTSTIVQASDPLSVWAPELYPSGRNTMVQSNNHMMYSDTRIACCWPRCVFPVYFAYQRRNAENEHHQTRTATTPTNLWPTGNRGTAPAPRPKPVLHWSERLRAGSSSKALVLLTCRLLFSRGRPDLRTVESAPFISNSV